MVGGWWRLAVGGSWRLAVGGPLGRSLRAVLNKKKTWFLDDPALGGGGSREPAKPGVWGGYCKRAPMTNDFSDDLELGGGDGLGGVSPPQNISILLRP